MDTEKEHANIDASEYIHMYTYRSVFTYGEKAKQLRDCTKFRQNADAQVHVLKTTSLRENPKKMKGKLNEQLKAITNN